MAKTNAERQAEYKKRTRQDARQLNMWVSGAAYLALCRLAKHSQLTKKQMVERMILALDEDIRKGLSDECFEMYMEVTR